jgi:hypothetical protein
MTRGKNVRPAAGKQRSPLLFGVGFKHTPQYAECFDGRIIFDGFATAKNFSDWILRRGESLRQAKIQVKLSTG